MKFHNAILAALCCFVAFGGSQEDWQTPGGLRKAKRLAKAPKLKYGPKWEMDGAGRQHQYMTIPVDQLYYTHGDSGRTGGSPTLSLSFTKGRNRHGQRVTLYDSILALLVGDDQVKKGIIHRLLDQELTHSTVTAKAVSDALWETQKAFKKTEKWDGVPEVVRHEGQMYSNSNRSLFVLQAIDRLFGLPSSIEVRCTRRDRIAGVHEYSRVQNCEDMRVTLPKYNRYTEKYHLMFPGGFFSHVECKYQAYYEAQNLGRDQLYDRFFDGRRRRMMAA